MKTSFAKNISLLIIAACALLISPACRRASDNGKLDGLWRIDKIEYFEPGEPEETATPVDLFLAINLELLQLDNPKPQATAIISYHKNGDTLGLDFPYNPKPELLRQYGIMENPCVLQVETLSCKRLLLNSGTSRIYCTRF